MSVVIETTLGDFTVDLYLTERPRACLNFLKLCKMKYYNFNLFHMVNHGFIAQTGDPTGEGDGGESIWGILQGSSKRYFQAETVPRIKHTKLGLVSFVGDKDNMLGSQFFITLAPDLTYLDARHNVFGEIVEGLENLYIFNETICDNNHRPYQDIRITHTVILDDPFPDPEGLVVPCSSPEPTAERLKGGRIAPDEEFDENTGKSATEIAETIAEREAKARATILEMVGDIPDADMAPPENVLFVCKLNPVTNDDDLEIIFSRFGKIKSCEVIRDKKTGDSLQYAFVEFENAKSCEDAYFKMDNVLIDDRRIHVDFSQSVAKVKWYGKGRIKYEGNQKNNLGKGKYEKVNHKSKNSSENNSYKNEKHYKSDSTEDKKYRNERSSRRSPIEERTRKNERSNRSSSVEDRKYNNERSSRKSPADERIHKNERLNRSSSIENKKYRDERISKKSPVEERSYKNERYNRSSPSVDRKYRRRDRSSSVDKRRYKNDVRNPKYSGYNDSYKSYQKYKYTEDYKSDRKYYDRRDVQYSRQYTNYNKYNDRDRDYNLKESKYKSERRYEEKIKDRSEYKRHYSTKDESKTKEYKKQKKKKRTSSSSDDSDS